MMNNETTTIDEVITRIKEKAQELSYYSKFEHNTEMYKYCMTRAAECEQLAFWLKELKEYRIAFNTVIDEKMKNVEIKAVCDKKIDEFTNEMLKKIEFEENNTDKRTAFKSLKKACKDTVEKLKD